MLWRAWGSAGPPEKITQEAFDRDDGHLRRLAGLLPGERAKPQDLWDYAQDLLYRKIQGPLLDYLLPFCLNAWREDLRGISAEYAGFIEWFYPVLAGRQIFEVHMTPKQSALVSEFMQQAILEEIDDQRGLYYKGRRARPYRWVGALMTHGVLMPDVEHFWNSWWSLDTVGGATAALQYISCLIYNEYENPVFAPWTSDEGGGPPCLWEFKGHLYRHRWLERNVDFLKKVLTAPCITDALTRAVERLADQPEYSVAKGIPDDLPLCIETLEARCAELPLLLATSQKPGERLGWSK